MTVNCPNCKTKQTTTPKTITVLQVKQDDALTPEVDIEVFECPKCKTIFNQDTNNQTDNPQKGKPTITDTIKKLCQVQLGLKQNLKNLRCNLGLLETERSGVLFELEALRRDSESRAEGLEEEIIKLRDESQGLKDVLGLSNESA